MLTVLTNIRSTKVLLAMQHSDILATLKNFISGFLSRILNYSKMNDFKNEDDLKMRKPEMIPGV